MPSTLVPSIYAIDFGTSNSLLAAAAPGQVFAPIPLDQAAPEPSILRSILYFSEEAEWSFGAEALKNYVAAGMRGRFMRSIKRFLPMLSFVDTRLGTKSVRLEELVGVFLREMRKRANLFFQADVRRVLLGRPARFSEDAEADALAEQRLASAARFAGFEEVLFCPEPVAAAYDFRSRMTRKTTVLVSDLGGGTSDFTVARLDPSQANSLEVLAVGGVPVAGDMFDGSLMRYKISSHFGAKVTYKRPFGANVLTMPRSLIDKLCSPAETCLLGRRDVLTFLQEVRSSALGADDRLHMDQLLCLVEDALGFQIFEAIETTKRELSEKQEAPFVFQYPTIDIHERVSRSEFETFSEQHTNKILGCLNETLKLAQVNPQDIDLVCSTGGTAKIPAISQRIAALFGPGKLHNLSSFHSVISGLAERARDLA